MTINVTEIIRKTMGWCPQKDLALAHIEVEKHGLSYTSLYKNGVLSEKGTNIIIDYQYMDIASIAIILFTALAALFVLFMVGFVLPIYREFVSLLVASPVFLAAVILLYQDRTNIEFTSTAIIIRRPFFKPIVISRDSILKTEVVKNYNHTIRWMILPVAIILLIFLGKDTMDIAFQYIAQKEPIAAIISIVFVKATTMLLFVVLFYKSKIRSYNPNALKITAKNKKEVTLYVDNPQELVSRIGGIR